MRDDPLRSGREASVLGLYLFFLFCGGHIPGTVIDSQKVYGRYPVCGKGQRLFSVCIYLTPVQSLYARASHICAAGPASESFNHRFQNLF